MCDYADDDDVVASTKEKSTPSSPPYPAFIHLPALKHGILLNGILCL